MGFYNLYAFGQFSGPYFLKTGLGVYSSNPLVFNKTSLMALFGMHIDQSQGILLQNPAYFIGFLFIVPFIRYNWRIGTIILLTYLSILYIKFNIEFLRIFNFKRSVEKTILQNWKLR